MNHNKSELNTSNYKRIFYINCLLSVPLIVLFAWPYVVFGYTAQIMPVLYYVGALIFSFPFTLTILHGHVTLALGSAHRHHYYIWLEEHPLTYGLLFRALFTSTRFRLVMVALSIIIFVIGWLIS
jgi:hypothetical protein